MPTSASIEIREEDWATLSRWTRSPSVPAGLATRARIVLGAGAGEGTSALSRRLGVSRPTVILRRERYAARGIEGLADEARPAGRRWSMTPG